MFTYVVSSPAPQLSENVHPDVHVRYNIMKNANLVFLVGVQPVLAYNL